MCVKGGTLTDVHPHMLSAWAILLQMTFTSLHSFEIRFECQGDLIHT